MSSAIILFIYSIFRIQKTLVFSKAASVVSFLIGFTIPRLPLRIVCSEIRIALWLELLIDSPFLLSSAILTSSLSYQISAINPLLFPYNIHFIHPPLLSLNRALPRSELQRKYMPRRPTAKVSLICLVMRSILLKTITTWLSQNHPWDRSTSWLYIRLGSTLASNSELNCSTAPHSVFQLLIPIATYGSISSDVSTSHSRHGICFNIVWYA